MSSSSKGRDALSSLNIPAFEVGRANMSGNWRQGQDSIALNMQDVIFLAPNFNARPAIWATGNINGSYTGNPQGAQVLLTGSGLTGNFNVLTWDQNRNLWLSSITKGSGGLSGGPPNMQNIYFQGISTGTINNNSGTFSGTGSGIVK